MGKRLNLRKENLIDLGGSGKIYSVGDKVVKVPKGFPSEKINGYMVANLKSEYFIHRDLYEAGISVPKPYGIIRINEDGERGIGILMDRIYGKTLLDLGLRLGPSKRDSLSEKMLAKVKKAENAKRMIMS